MAATSPLTEKLIAYADGRPVDGDTQRFLDGMIVDYIDGLLDPRAARDLERSMRQSPVVARLVADKAEEIDLRNRLSMFHDGALDRRAMQGLEAAMRLSPSMARLIADRIGEART